MAVTPLMLAAMMGNADCVRLLIDGGANTEARDMVRAIEFVCIVVRYIITVGLCVHSYA